MSDHTLPFMVGLAAATGGLEALSQLVRQLAGGHHTAAYVIAAHMSVPQEGIWGAVMSRESSLRVRELQEDQPLRPKADTLYVAPPGFAVVLNQEGKLTLCAAEASVGQAVPLADRLFTSLARHCGARCAGVVLSGNGSDGSYGLQAIRESGGITIVQDPQSTQYPAMPLSALRTGCVDLTLAPAEIGAHLGKILSGTRDFDALQALQGKPDKFSELFQVLSARTGVDFREYRTSTITRRITRRMLALGVADYDAYLAACRADAAEVDALYRDLMISVTRFFRDPQAFEALKSSVQEMLETLATAEQRCIRVWVAGCATGEEAYSVAILFLEAMGGIEVVSRHRLQVFATDIDPQALDVARRGRYPITARADIPAPLLERYFTLQSDTIEVTKSLRGFVLFSRHNIVQDPPFTNLDCISLRNLLIYFNGGLQDKVLARAGYALTQGGLLFLGAAETIGALDRLFATRDPLHRIYSKREMTRKPLAVPPLPVVPQPAERPGYAGGRAAARQFDNLIRVLAPNGVLASSSGAILRILGDMSMAMAPSVPSGPQTDLKILQPVLRYEAASLMNQALRSRVVSRGQWHALPGLPRQQLCLTCYPIPQSDVAAYLGHPSQPYGADSLVLIALDCRIEEDPSGPAVPPEPGAQEAYIRQIEEEVGTTRQALQQSIEQLQTSNEALQSVNEEMQAANEELQATNEALETSNEELQSTNEELITVNEEILANSARIQHLSAELEAVLHASPFVMIVVDQALQVRHASREAMTLFALDHLPKSGVHISQCAPVAGLPDLVNRICRVFSSREAMVEHAEFAGQCHEMTFTPFYQCDGRALSGVAVTIL
ncbi:CheR family methyltransferase [Phaeobacter sp. HF9A]|uniref:CheR family methyltransferase n=1 Tax=Phaeobacter sp. HF9A TaxID=2721561 RepID=UPI001430C6F0|nr:CheR family methyltransferase [Phaeobacter sp. HF9A]NIZ14665.1 chemotaxis protein CheR [Phaeobacter sp. HF9A]